MLLSIIQLLGCLFPNLKSIFSAEGQQEIKFSSFSVFSVALVMNCSYFVLLCCSSSSSLLLTAPSDPEDHDVDSDATEMLSDVEGGTAGNRKRKHSAQATGSTAAGGTTARPAYYVDRLSEAAQMRQRQQQQQGQGQGPVGRGAAVSAAAAGVAGITSVPQVQGVRSALSGGPKSRSVPANNRLKIMKKLGLKL